MGRRLERHRDGVWLNPQTWFTSLDGEVNLGCGSAQTLLSMLQGVFARCSGQNNAFSLPSKNVENNPMQSSDIRQIGNAATLDTSGKSRALQHNLMIP